MAQKPIGYYGTFTPTGVDPTVAQRMEQLAGVAGQVADMAVGFGKAQASADAPEQALADVAKAREEGTELKKKSPFAWGSETYNQVAFKAYESGVNHDLKNALLDAQAQNPNDINAYREVASQALTMLNNAPPEIQVASTQFYKNINSDIERQIDEQAKIKADASIAANLAIGMDDETTSILNSARGGDLEAVDAGLTKLTLDVTNGIDAGVLNSSAITQLESLKDNIAIQGVIGELDRTLLSDQKTPLEQIAAGKEFVNRLIQARDIEGLDPTQTDNLIKQLSAKVNDKELKYKKEQNTLTKEEGLELSSLVFNIRTGNINSEDALQQISDMVNRGVIRTPEERIKYEGYVVTEIKKNRKLEDQNATINNVLNGIPTNRTYDKADVNKYYSSWQENLSTDPIERVMAQAEFAKSLGIVPSDMSSQIQNDIMSADSEKIVLALDLMNRIIQKPAMSEVFSANDFALAEQIQFNLEYMPDNPQQAIKMALSEVDINNKAKVTARKEAFEDATTSTSTRKPKVDLDADVAGFYETMFGPDFNPLGRNTAKLVADYKELVETYWVAGVNTQNNFNQAREMAKKDIETQWGKTSLTGDGVMKFSPNKFYTYANGLGISDEDVRDEIFNIAIKDNKNINFTKENIYVFSDDETDRIATLGGDFKPTYTVFALNNDGILEQLFFESIDSNIDLTDPNSRRADGSIKSARGYLGPIKNLVQGGTMTEVSIDTEVDGYGEIQIPTMVPTLTKDEINILANMQLEGNAKNIPKSIINKAKKHAKQRLDNGLNPFYQDKIIINDRFYPKIEIAQEKENARIKEKADRAVSQQDLGLLSEYPLGDLTGRFPEGSEIIDIGEGLIGPNPVDVIKAAQLTGPSYVPSSKIGKVSNLEQSLPASDLIKNVSKFNKQFIKNLKKSSTKRKDK